MTQAPVPAADGLRVVLCAPGETWGGVDRFVMSFVAGLRRRDVRVWVALFHDGLLASMLREAPDPAQARRLCSLTARTFAASLLIRHAPAQLADLYCSTRLDWTGDRVFGELPSGFDVRAMVNAVTPRLG